MNDTNLSTTTNESEFQSYKSYECDGFDSYVRKEWDMFHSDTQRSAAMMKATDGMNVSNILDIGCGAGQEMWPFIEKGSRGFGLDYVPRTGIVGRDLYTEEGYGDKVSFLRGSGDRLPFDDGAFDVVICRGAIMFMDNSRALSEFSRVLAPGGVLFLMFQAPPYYWWKIRRGFADGNLLSAVHAARVLYGGSIFYLTGRQSYDPLTAGGEIFQTRKRVIQEAAKHRLELTGEMPCSNDQVPSLIMKKA